MPKAIWDGAVLAESDNCNVVDGSRYSPVSWCSVAVGV